MDKKKIRDALLLLSDAMDNLIEAIDYEIETIEDCIKREQLSLTIDDMALRCCTSYYHIYKLVKREQIASSRRGNRIYIPIEEEKLIKKLLKC